MSTVSAHLHVDDPRPDVLGADELAAALAVRDLTDPARGPHATQLVVDLLQHALRARWNNRIHLIRTHPLVPVEDNYERLGYPPDAVTRDARYTRYVSETCMLRSHTSAAIPPALRDLARRAGGPRSPRGPWDDVLLVCPGMVYRRDVVDRIHTGTPHQIDLWRIVRSGRRLAADDLDEMIDTVVHAVLPEAAYRAVPASHPYTEHGRQVDVRHENAWVEVGECGLAARHVLERAGLDESVSGLAMGLGLDRLVMLRKGIPDIRLLSATDRRIADQMLDLAPYRRVSKHPPISRDLSVAVDADADAETLGGTVRDVLGPHADAVEEIRVIAETPTEDLPDAAIARLGARAGQKNVLLRIVLRDPARTLSDAEANTIRDRVYAAVHRGTAHQWTGPRPPGADPSGSR
jgi:phenylalanyl-tRNA synthetase alpha chain